MYKIDRRGGGVQKSFTRTDPITLLFFACEMNIEVRTGPGSDICDF